MSMLIIDSKDRTRHMQTQSFALFNDWEEKKRFGLLNIMSLLRVYLNSAKNLLKSTENMDILHRFQKLVMTKNITKVAV